MDYHLGLNSFDFKTEFQLPVDTGYGVSLFGEGRVGEHDYRAILGGLRIYFGDPGKSLIARHREDDAHIYLADDFELLGQQPSAHINPALLIQGSHGHGRGATGATGANGATGATGPTGGTGATGASSAGIAEAAVSNPANTPTGTAAQGTLLEQTTNANLTTLAQNQITLWEYRSGSWTIFPLVPRIRTEDGYRITSILAPLPTRSNMRLRHIIMHQHIPKMHRTLALR